MFVVRFGRTLKNNPKKSIAASVVLAWAGNWLKKKYEAHLFRRAECQTAAVLGRETLKQFDSPKRVTVFLNPAANDGKASQLYEKYAAPILHLAGFDVHLVKLGYEGDAKKLMSVVEGTDMIICAGGDGTLSEVVTGLLRRSDSEGKNIPIGVIPLGKTNVMCRRLLPDADSSKHPQFISSAATACTKNMTTHVDVMKIEGSAGKTVYAVSSIRWGSLCDLQERSKKMWYFGGLKSYAPFLFSTMKGNVGESHEFSIKYADPEDVPVIEEEHPVPLSTNAVSGTSIISNFFARLWPWRSSAKGIKELEKLDPSPEKETVEKEWHEFPPKKSIEFLAQANTHLNSSDREKAYMKITLESDTISASDFLSKGPYTIQNVIHTPINVDLSFEADSFKLSSVISETDNQKISIDNDRYEAMDITVELLPNCIKMIRSPKLQTEK